MQSEHRPVDTQGMPYDRNDELPASVRKKYTPKQQRAFRKAYNDAAKQGKSEAVRFQVAHAAARRAGDRDATQQKVGHKSKPKSQKAFLVGEEGPELHDYARTFSAQQRKKLAQKGHALSDGSFPIVNKADLRNAIQAYGRASNKSSAKRHIIKRARALGATNLLPESWTKNKDSAMSLLECEHEGCNRKFVDEAMLHDHAESVHTLSEKRSLVSKAVRTVHGREAFLIDLSDDWLIYDVFEEGGYTLYRQNYELDNAGNVKIKGDPTEVVRKVSYVPAPKVETAASTVASLGITFASKGATAPRGASIQEAPDETAEVKASQSTVELSKSGTKSDYPKKSGTKNDSFKCPKCDSEFESEGDLKDHKKKKGH